MIIIGEKEEDNKTVSVRSGDNGEEGEVDLILMCEILPSSLGGEMNCLLGKSCNIWHIKTAHICAHK